MWDGTKQVLGEAIMFLKLFNRSRDEFAIDETHLVATQRLMGRMENMLDDMADRQVMESIRFATSEKTPSYYRA
jgi:predicted SpoU family rRNA methylase